MSVEKEIRKIQRESLKNMNNRQRLSYIWGYYKWHILFTLFIAILLISITKDLIINNRPSYINILLINASPFFSGNEELEQDIAEFSNVDLNKYNINIDPSIYISEQDSDTLNPMNIGSVQKFMALYASNDVDVMIAPETFIDMYLHEDMYADPVTIAGEELIAKLEEAGFPLYYRKLSEFKDQEEAKESEEPFEDREICIGIKINNSDYLNSLNVYDNAIKSWDTPVIFTFSGACKNPEHSLEFLNLISGIQNS